LVGARTWSGEGRKEGRQAGQKEGWKKESMNEREKKSLFDKSTNSPLLWHPKGGKHDGRMKVPFERDQDQKGL